MALQEPPWRVSADAVLLSLRLTPRSSKDALEGVETLADGRSVLKARVRAVPEGGKANLALLRLLADQLDCPIRAVSLTTGATGRTKVIRIEGAPETTLARLAALLTGADQT